MANFTEQVALVLEEEIRVNNKLMQDWIAHPHSQSTSPQRNTLKLNEVTSPVWYPERPPISHAMKTVYNR